MSGIVNHNFALLFPNDLLQSGVASPEFAHLLPNDLRQANMAIPNFALLCLNDLLHNVHDKAAEDSPLHAENDAAVPDADDVFHGPVPADLGRPGLAKQAYLCVG